MQSGGRAESEAENPHAGILPEKHCKKRTAEIPSAEKAGEGSKADCQDTGNNRNKGGKVSENHRFYYLYGCSGYRLRNQLGYHCRGALGDCLVLLHSLFA